MASSCVANDTSVVLVVVVAGAAKRRLIPPHICTAMCDTLFLNTPQGSTGLGYVPNTAFLSLHSLINNLPGNISSTALDYREEVVVILPKLIELLYGVFWFKKNTSNNE